MATRLVSHPRELQIILRSMNGAVAKDLLRRGNNVRTKAKLNLDRAPRRIDTGTLRSSIGVSLYTLSGAPAVRVGTNLEYAIYVHDGTGIYGPKGMPIYPSHAKALRWKSKTGVHYAAFILGMEPNPFLKDAVDAAKD